MRHRRTGKHTAKGPDLGAPEANPATRGGDRPVRPSLLRINPTLVLIDGECPITFTALVEGIEAEFQPHGPMAALLVDYAATLLWRLRRIPSFEAGLFAWIGDQQRHRHDQKGLELGDVFFAADTRALPSAGPQLDAPRRHRAARLVIGRTISAALDKSDPLGKIGRYEGHLVRQLSRTFDELRRLRADHAVPVPTDLPISPRSH